MHVIKSAAGLQVSAMGLGCMNLTDGYGPVDPGRAGAVLRRALDLDVRFWDTADAYGHGDNERLLGEFLAGVPRDEVVVATKFGGVFDTESKRPTGVRGDAAYVREACDASLRRLGLDHIDLFYQHLPDVDVPVEETVGAMGELVEAGKVRHIGLSNIGAEQIRAAHRVHPIAAVQQEWNLFYRNVEPGIVPACAELGIIVVPYSPLGRGVLTGETIELAPDDERQIFPRFAGENVRRNTGLVASVRTIADARGVTPAQVALAWLLHRTDVHGLGVVPIPGTKRVERLEENVAALDVRLDRDELDALEGLADRVAGARLPDLPPDLQRYMPEVG